MYLIIYEEYRIYKHEILTGEMRSKARQGELSVVNLKTMKGMNRVTVSDTGSVEYFNNEEWSDIQDWDKKLFQKKEIEFYFKNYPEYKKTNI